MKNKKGVIGSGIFFAILIGIVLLLGLNFIGGKLLAGKVIDITKSVPIWFWVILIIILFIILGRKK